MDKQQTKKKLKIAFWATLSFNFLLALYILGSDDRRIKIWAVLLIIMLNGLCYFFELMDWLVWHQVAEENKRRHNASKNSGD